MNQFKVYLLPIIFIPIFLFIITSLIYDHYQRGYLFTSRSSNESIFIERALKQISICNQEDSSRQRALLYTLQAWTHLAHSHHIRYWISHETLISNVQQQGLLPYDHQIDITIMAEDTPQLIELTKANFSSIYKLKVHPQWFITEASSFSEYNAQFMNQENNVSINIRPIYDYYSTKNVRMLAEYINSNTLILSPIEWTFPLEPCVFSGIKLWCPSQPKKLVRFMYGQTSIDISCINGTWVKS
jgi:hypothetical protein